MAASATKKSPMWNEQLVLIGHQLESPSLQTPGTSFLQQLLTIKKQVQEHGDYFLSSDAKILLEQKIATLSSKYLKLAKLSFLEDTAAPLNKSSFAISLINSVERGDLLSLQFLIERIYPRCLNVEIELGMAFSRAVVKSQIACARLLLTQPISIPSWHLSSALSSAAELGNLDMVDFLLSENREFSAPALSAAVVKATIKDKNPCFRRLLHLNPPIASLELKHAACSLVKHHDLENLQLLLSHPRTLSFEHLGHVLTQAITCKHFIAAPFIISLGSIDSFNLGKSFVEAASQGALDILKLLASTGRPIMEMHRARAAIAACENGNLECLQFIHAGGEKLNSLDTGRALHTVMIKRHFHLFPFLLIDAGTFNEFDIILAYRDLAAAGNLSLLEFLAATRRPQEPVGFTHAINSALIFGHTDCALFLLSLMPTISTLSQIKLLEIAIKNQQEDPIRILVSMRPLALDAIESLLKIKSSIDAEKLRRLLAPSLDR